MARPVKPPKPPVVVSPRELIDNGAASLTDKNGSTLTQ